MNPGIKKAAAVKTMRVASTFTGVAACAAAVAPPAIAGTGHVVPRYVPQVRPLATESGACISRTKHWLHLANSETDLCFGYRGVKYTSFPTISFCGGNNSGFFNGYFPDGKAYSIAFRQGSTYARIRGTGDGVSVNVSEVDITGYTGNDSCG
jgi:hypothetical protein